MLAVVLPWSFPCPPPNPPPQGGKALLAPSPLVGEGWGGGSGDGRRRAGNSCHTLRIASKTQRRRPSDAPVAITAIGTTSTSGLARKPRPATSPQPSAGIRL